MKSLLFLLSVCWITSIQAQALKPTEGIPQENPTKIALTHAHIVVSPDLILDDATLLIENGLVKQTGKDLSIPAGYEIRDLKGAWIYPSFIDPYTQVGMPKSESKSEEKGYQTESARKGNFYWNDAIKSDVQASTIFQKEEEQAKKYREMGFGVVHTFQADGIARGFSTVAQLSENQNLTTNFKSLSCFSFQKGSSTQSYPGSLMGSIALLRQAFYDAQWYEQAQQAYQKNPNQKAPQNNISLEALNKQMKNPMVFELKDNQDYFRIKKIADEFKLQVIYKGTGFEQEFLKDSPKETWIIPLKFPNPFAQPSQEDALQYSLMALKRWEQAPFNPFRMFQNGMQFCITAEGLDKETFFANLRKAVNCDLPEKEALSALTTRPAKLLGLEQSCGSLENGKQANFLICSGNIFKDSTVIYENWLQDQKYILQTFPEMDLRGTWSWKFDNQEFILEISGSKHAPEAKIKSGKTETSAKINTNSFPKIDLSFNGKEFKKNNIILASGLVENGKWFLEKSELKRTKSYQPENKPVSKDNNISAVTFPNMEYGLNSIPTAGHVLIQNATIWTNTDKGILKNTDVRLMDGKITEIGTKLSSNGAEIIDGSQKHLTCGIIDEHSHIAIYGDVNEATQSVTAEVRIGDVLHSQDINIYRQLSGGVTTSHLLHGSANCIGGQTELIKMRWGANPEQLKFDPNFKFIKCALGENVKQSNWGDDFTTRFPQTRMGVEATFENAFLRAMNYRNSWKEWEQNGKSQNKIPPAKDLELETLLEIIDSKRFITCHSYVQSEILMLMQVAEKFGFKVNTFTHILEGYKVSSAMKAHGAHASTFSDWWAYKYEVMDAIPHNAALLAQAGIPTAVNSDDAEMARRLNQEAAKAVKYGNLSEEEAWKLCTLNPAKMLHIDNRVGSVAVGKDADVVLWSDHPLSVYARVEKTFVDGKLYYDLKKDEEMRKFVMKERERILNKMAASEEQTVIPEPYRTFFIHHCETDEHQH